MLLNLDKNVNIFFSRAVKKSNIPYFRFAGRRLW